MFRPKEITIKCQSCGHDNELGRIFCARCGVQLDIKSLRPPKRDPKTRGRKPLTVRKILSRVVIVAVLVAIVAILVAVLYVPAEAAGAKPGGNTRLVRTQKISLSKAQGMGKAAAITINQDDINAYLAEADWPILRGRRVDMAVKNVRIDLREGTVVVHILADVSWAKYHKDLYIQYAGIPKVEKDGFVCETAGARLGLLPVPGVLIRGTIQKRLAGFFRNFVDEQEILDRLSAIEVHDGKAVLRTKGK